MTFTRREKTGPVPAAVFGDTGSWKTASRALEASVKVSAGIFRVPPLLALATKLSLVTGPRAAAQRHKGAPKDVLDAPEQRAIRSQFGLGGR